MYPPNLSKSELDELESCEKVIERGWKTFVEVGQALATIRDNRLYREKFSTFDAYCKDRWNYRKAYAYQLIAAAQVVKQLSAIADIPKPTSESQVRPLTGLRPEDAVEAWKSACEQAGDKDVTAKIVKKAATKFHPPKEQKQRESKSQMQNARPRIARAGLLSTLDQLEAAIKKKNGRDLSLRLVKKLRKQLHAGEAA